MVTHLLDTSAALAGALGEPGMERVRALLEDPDAVVGVSVLTLFEDWTTFLHRTHSGSRADEAVADLRQVVSEVASVDEAVLNLAFDLRRTATARIALADCLIAATAVRRGAVLVHRDPHFAALPYGKPMQETLPDKLSSSQSF